MEFVPQAGAAFLLVTLTLLLQCGGLAVLVAWARRALASEIQKLGPFRSAALIMRFTTAGIVLNGLHIALWASFYHWLCFRSWAPAVYFSAGSYSTVGAGDVALPPKWQILGPLESVVGVLMAGVQVGLLVALILELVQRKERLSHNEAILHDETLSPIVRRPHAKY